MCLVASRYFADLEKAIVSVERIREYQNTPIEAPPKIPDSDPPAKEGWPRSGVIEFKDYETRYRDGMDLVLRGVSFRIKDGDKVKL